MLKRFFTASTSKQIITEAADFLAKQGHKEASKQLILREIEKDPADKAMRAFLVNLEKKDVQNRKRTK